jgi:hypothetical protein
MYVRDCLEVGSVGNHQTVFVKGGWGRMNLFKVHCIHLWKYHKEISKLRIIKINYLKKKKKEMCVE